MFTLNYEVFALREVGYDLSRITLSGPDPYKLLYESAVHTTGVTETSCVATGETILIARLTGSLLWYPQNRLRHLFKGTRRVDSIVQELMAQQKRKQAEEAASLFPS